MKFFGMSGDSDIVIEYNFEEGGYLIYTELAENIYDAEIVLSTNTNFDTKVEKNKWRRLLK